MQGCIALCATLIAVMTSMSTATTPAYHSDIPESSVYSFLPFPAPSQAAKEEMEPRMWLAPRRWSKPERTTKMIDRLGDEDESTDGLVSNPEESTDMGSFDSELEAYFELKDKPWVTQPPPTPRAPVRK